MPDDQKGHLTAGPTRTSRGLLTKFVISFPPISPPQPTPPKELTTSHRILFIIAIPFLAVAAAIGNQAHSDFTSLPKQKAEQSLTFSLDLSFSRPHLQFSAGTAGTFVLLDYEHKKFALTRSQFGEMWFKLIAFNPMFNVLFFVGGFYGLLFTYVKLSGDKKARAAAKENVKTPKKGAKAETKKAK